MNKKKASHNKIYIILAVMFLVIFCISAYKTFSIIRELKKESNEFEKLLNYRENFKNEHVKSDDIKDASENDMLSYLESLYLKNQDIAGWINIDDTKINYPVMFTPEDPEYYIHRSFSKEHSSSGVPFIGEDSSPDSENVMIYGHNMKNGSMFAELLKYKDESFWREHGIIHFDSLYEERSYEIIGAFYSRAYYEDEGENTFEYYNYSNLNSKEEYEEYVRQVKQTALYDTGIGAEYGDQLITLSTCSYHEQDGRFVVVGRRCK